MEKKRKNEYLRVYLLFKENEITNSIAEKIAEKTGVAYHEFWGKVTRMTEHMQQHLLFY
jgi:hypothetical protein